VLATVEFPLGFEICTTRPPVAAPAAIEIVAVACVPASLTIQIRDRDCGVAALFWRNVRLVAPANPAPVSVSAKVRRPRAATGRGDAGDDRLHCHGHRRASEVAGVGADGR